MIVYYNTKIVWNGVEMDMLQKFQLEIEVGGVLHAIFDNFAIPIYHFEVKKNGEDYTIYIESY